jgi:hypothetical protein
MARVLAIGMLFFARQQESPTNDNKFQEEPEPSCKMSSFFKAHHDGLACFQETRDLTHSDRHECLAGDSRYLTITAPLGMATPGGRIVNILFWIVGGRFLCPTASNSGDRTPFFQCCAPRANSNGIGWDALPLAAVLQPWTA